MALGESTHLVNEVRYWRSDDPPTGRMLVPDIEGDLSMPVWPDHVGSKGTTWGQFRLEEMKTDLSEPPGQMWITIAPEM